MATQPRGDALLAPSRGAAFITELVQGDHVVRGVAPVTLPAGWVHGLPVGIMLFGAQWNDPTVIFDRPRFRAAYARLPSR